MNYYLLPSNIPAHIQPHLESCQWGNFIHRTTEERFRIKNAIVFQKFKGQCRPTKKPLALFISFPLTEKLETGAIKVRLSK